MALRGRLGRYRLVRRLAVGGMAEVYLAVAEGLSGFEKRVVVKRLLPQHARESELVAMFLDEARLVATLAHPHIGEVYDVGAEEGEYFFAMEHIAGRDLRDLLEARPGQPLPLPEALAIVEGVAAGLHHAHEQRDERGRLLEIVHRDVSPSNVLVSAAGQVKLVDFGVAKWAAQRTETRHGVLKGKCAYMSPEQCRAEPLDRRSDVFSLGVLLYEITTGRRPFEGNNDFELMTAIVRGAVLSPTTHRPDYPPDLVPIVLRALAPVRDERYPTAQALAHDLAAFAARAHLVAAPGALARLLEDLFGTEAAGGTFEPTEEEGDAGPSAADARGAPPPPALDRTATDHQAHVRIQPLAAVAPVSPVRRAGAFRRIALVAGVSLAGIGGVALVASSMRKPPAASAPSVVAAPVGVAPASVVTSAPAVAAMAPAQGTGEIAAPVQSPSEGKERDAGPPRATRSARRPPPAPAAASLPTEERVRVWDPDSPLPPPP